MHALAAPSAGCRVTAVASAGGSSARHLAASSTSRCATRCAPCRSTTCPPGPTCWSSPARRTPHVALALRGLAAGADALVEKPLATNLADADRLVDATRAATASGVVLRCAENLLHALSWAVVTGHRSAMGPLQPPVGGPRSRRVGALHPTAHRRRRPVRPRPARPGAGDGAGRRAGRVGDRRAVLHPRRRRRRRRGAVALRLRTGRHGRGVVDRTGGGWSLQAASADGVARLELSPDVLVEIDGERWRSRTGSPARRTRRWSGWATSDSWPASRSPRPSRRPATCSGDLRRARVGRRRRDRGAGAVRRRPDAHPDAAVAGLSPLRSPRRRRRRRTRPPGTTTRSARRSWSALDVLELHEGERVLRIRTPLDSPRVGSRWSATYCRYSRMSTSDMPATPWLRRSSAKPNSHSTASEIISVTRAPRSSSNRSGSLASDLLDHLEGEVRGRTRRGTPSWCRRQPVEQALGRRK